MTLSSESLFLLNDLLIICENNFSNAEQRLKQCGSIFLSCCYHIKKYTYYIGSSAVFLS